MSRSLVALLAISLVPCNVSAKKAAPSTPPVSSEEPVMVVEESKCSMILQEFQGIKLVALTTDYLTGQTRFVYAKKVDKEHVRLILFVRKECADPMVFVKSMVVNMPGQKTCPPGAKCL